MLRDILKLCDAKSRLNRNSAQIYFKKELGDVVLTEGRPSAAADWQVSRWPCTGNSPLLVMKGAHPHSQQGDWEDGGNTVVRTTEQRRWHEATSEEEEAARMETGREDRSTAGGTLRAG